MSKRYGNRQTYINKENNKSAYKTTIYNDVPKSNDDMYVITQEGDRLDNLAYEYYGDQYLWWFIARVNNLKAINVEAGTRLRIPTSTINAKTK